MLSPGSRLGPYEILSLAGSGGMGEVYKARDTRLERTVAIKILPPALGADPQFRDRFGREARAISQLTHPHVCRLYDLGRHDGADFLVMEFLEGESLADRLARSRDRALPLQEMLAIATQVAEALDAAHRAGIVHRDLKPGNIILTRAGAKLVDFGLAKQALSMPVTPAGADVSPTSLSSPPTVTSPLTLIGAIVGTLQYMSPEQLDGKEADTRSDVFAFGAVLYEMLTGRRAFEGKTQVSVMAAIIEHDPTPLASITPSTPAALTRLVEKCLAKDPNSRWQSVADLADELRWIARTHGSRPARVSGVDVARMSPRAWAIAGAALAVVLIAVAVAGFVLTRGRRSPAAAVARFEIQTRADEPLAVSGGQDRDIAISPDGQHIAYSIGQPGTSRLVIRDIGQLEGRIIGTGRQPFFSPDSASVGFSTAANQLMTMAVTGGPATLVTQLIGSLRGATWGPDDTIVLATTDRTGLLSVSSAGGPTKEITKPDIAGGEHDHYFPSFLPNGRAVLFTIVASGGLEMNKVAVLDLATGRQKVLVQGASQAEYVEDDSGRGYLLYAAGATLRAVRFDADRLELSGNAVPVVDQVTTTPNGAASYAIARNGTMIFIPGGLVGVLGGPSGVPRTLTWVDRQGREEPIELPARSYSIARLSPDGTRVALEIDDENNDIWTADLRRRTLTRLTTDPGSDTRPVWTSDGKRIIFTSTRTGAPNLFWRASDGSGSDERLTESLDLQLPSAVTLDGTLLFVEVVPGHGGDIMSLGLPVPPGRGVSRQPGPLIATSFIENNPEPSPDGQWIAYTSNASSVTEVYVRPFPNVNDALYQVSSGGGSRPVWRGNEIFFLDANNMLTSVHVDTKNSSFSAGRAVRILGTAYFSGTPQRPHDVTADGQKFLMIKDPGGDRSQSLPRLAVVLNWTQELKSRVR